ncbi:hypothetical protein [Bacillus sp. MRMR6]|uniref:hypothetical protein n=1 Tax=Bacillus sp. MRMR6 TaxID=1928617 RepID=UPI0009529667|nr:hypothetical protein [Bacillus sp. MRMR6]OLS41870.1 hypothetical protein BTR25_00420 [Bacillus sp. MRMR6]
MRKVYVLLTDTGTVLTKIIKLYTKKQHNHASIALDDELWDVYSFGRKRPSNPFLAGFVRENIRGGIFRKADCAIYCCTISEEQYETVCRKIREIEANKSDYRYNLLGLFAVMFNMEFDRKNAFFCSHFVAALLEECGVEINKRKPLSLVTPDDIKKSTSLELVYEGKLSSYFLEPNPEHIKDMSHPKYYREFNTEVI